MNNDAAATAITGNPIDALKQPLTQEQDLLSQLRQERRSLELGKQLELPIPGYRSMLVGRFEKVVPEELEEMSRRMQLASTVDERLSIGADLVLRQCAQVLMRSANGSYYPVPDATRIDKNLAKSLGIDGTDSMTAREALFAILGNRGESGILGLVRQVMDWSAGVSDDVREVLAGERAAIQS